MAERQALARNWLDVIVCARAPFAPLSPKVPIVRDRVIEAQYQIESLADALMAPLPTARGVAMARSLLSDGAGPIYNARVQLISVQRSLKLSPGWIH